MNTEHNWNDFLLPQETEVEKVIRENWIAVDGTYKINSNGSIDVEGNVKLTDNGTKKIPLVFNIVSGTFDCSKMRLTTLENCPKKVGGDFNCSFNHLISLEYAPIDVGGTFMFDNSVKNLYTGYCVNNFTQVFRNSKVCTSEEDIEVPRDHLKLFFKYQGCYGVWDSLGVFDEINFSDLLEDLEDGLR
jgi:hypothetical protein